MQLTHTVHPPGAAAALIAVIGGPAVTDLGWWYPLLPIGIGCVIMLVVAILVNNLARHRRRSEERRVGKEGRWRRSTREEQKKEGREQTIQQNRGATRE